MKYTECQVEETDTFFVTEKHYEDGFTTKSLDLKIKMSWSVLEECTGEYLSRKDHIEALELEPKKKVKSLKELQEAYEAVMRYLSYTLTSMEKQRERYGYHNF